MIHESIRTIHLLILKDNYDLRSLTLSDLSPSQNTFPFLYPFEYYTIPLVNSLFFIRSF